MAEGTPDELKRLVPGGHVRLAFTDAAELDRAARMRSMARSRDDEALTLQVPSDGGVGSLRALLDRLEAEVDRCRRALAGRPPTSTTSSCR